MNQIIPILEQAIPLIIIITLSVFMTLERWIPYRQHSNYRKRQRWHNLGNLAISFVLNALLGGIIAFSITWGTKNQFGLLFQLPIYPVIATIIGIFLCDLNGYIAHRLYHKIPIFWKFHRVHHSDTELDASSGLRLHPFEFMLQAITQATILPLLGVSNVSYVVYTAFAVVMFVINHTNIRFPIWYENLFSLLIVTPNWHRVHHSNYQPETDANFGDVFTVWDRIFGTKVIINPETITFGLETLRENKDQTFIAQMKTPFVK